MHCSLLKHSALNYNYISLRMCTEPVRGQVFLLLLYLLLQEGPCPNHKLRHSGKSIFHTHRYHYIKPLILNCLLSSKQVNILLGTQIMLIVAHSVRIVKIFLALAENIK